MGLNPKGTGYGSEIDVFTLGVIFFTIYAGFMPWNVQKKSDWYWAKLAKGKTKDFWRGHEQARPPSVEHPKGWTPKFEPEFKDLIEKMLVFKGKERISLDNLMKHKWFTKETLTDAQGADEMKKKENDD